MTISGVEKIEPKLDFMFGLLLLMEDTGVIIKYEYIHYSDLVKPFVQPSFVKFSLHEIEKIDNTFFVFLLKILCLYEKSLTLFL